MNKQTNRQNLPNTGTLWVVATPIGNLEDITERAKKVLTEVDQILCEDTRQTMKLISALKLKTKAKLVRFDEHASELKRNAIKKELLSGQSMVLVSDAGTPLISDPGAQLIRELREEEISVIPIPGVSAVSTFLSVSGLQFQSFTFRGFFPRELKNQKIELESFLDDPYSEVWIWFESPKRIQKTISFLKKNARENEIFLAKEMTKRHEKYVLCELSQLDDRFDEQGEWCFALKKTLTTRAQKIKKKLNPEPLLRQLSQFEIPTSQLAKILASHTGHQRQLLYEEIKKVRKKS